MNTELSQVNYHSDFSSVSKTMLNLFMDSRLEYYLTYVSREMAPKPATKPMLVGTILHAMLLEDRMFSDLVLPYPGSVLKSNGDLNGKSAAAFRDDHPDLTFLKASECDKIRAVVDGVLKHPDLGKLLAAATHREKRFDSTIEGVDCKCKPDIACDMSDRIVVYDMKFSESVDPDSWRRSSRRLRYWAQDALYSSVVEGACGMPVEFRFCLVEVLYPFRVQWKWFDPASRETSRSVVRGKLVELAGCHKTGDWSDRWDSVTVLEPYDIPDDDLVEVSEST